MAAKRFPQKHNYRNDLTAEYVRSILLYFPKTGQLFWKDRPELYHPINVKMRGTLAGTVKPSGHRDVAIDKHIYAAARLIWLIQTGKWPKHEVDHKNVKPDDNRWKNLREATPGQNCQNKRLRPDNTSGFKGVSWQASIGKWKASIGFERQFYYLGIYDRLEDAAAAYRKAARRFHRKFARFK